MQRPSDGEFVRRVLIAAGIVLLGWALFSVRDLLLVILAALLLSLALRAAAEGLHRRLGVPLRWALAFTILAVLALLGAAAWLFGAEVVAQVDVLREALPRAWNALLQRYGDTVVADQLRSRMADASPDGAALLAGVGAAVSTVTGVAGAVLLAFVGAIYLAADPDLYQAGLLKLVPGPRRDLAHVALGETARALRLWLLGQLVSMSVIGVLTGLGLAWVGLPSALALGLLAGLLAFVPLVGPIVSAIPALLLALADGAATVGWTLAVFVGVQQIEGNVVMPFVQRRMVDLPPALLLFAIVAAGTLLGPLGALLAAPLTVVVFVLVKRLYVREALDTPTPLPGEERGD
ncbi:MAG: AI-2E family transporter [Steroidobacteraceae bacterium]|mgnify:FL=1